MFSRKLNQVTLAALCDTTHSTVGRWLHGSIPRGSMARRLCVALNVASDWLFNGQGEMTSTPPVAQNIGALTVRLAMKAKAQTDDTMLDLAKELQGSHGNQRDQILAMITDLADILRRIKKAEGPDSYGPLKAAEDSPEFKISSKKT